MEPALELRLDFPQVVMDACLAVLECGDNIVDSTKEDDKVRDAPRPQLLQKSDEILGRIPSQLTEIEHTYGLVQGLAKRGEKIGGDGAPVGNSESPNRGPPESGDDVCPGMTFDTRGLSQAVDSDTDEFALERSLSPELIRMV
jgi:hypothetical protein